MFRLKVECHKRSDQIGCQSSCHVQSCDPAAVKTLCQVQDDWETAAVMRAVQLVQLVQQVAATSQSEQPLLMFSHDELERSQELDLTISKVLPFILHKRCPSR